jgi:hypothetical protein
MATPRANTLQEKFGFMDPELNDPVHDEMITRIDDNIEDILMLVFGCSERPKHVRTWWEAVVHKTEEGGALIGFADLVVEVSEHMIVFEAKTKIDSLGALFRQIRLYRDGYIYGSPVYKMSIVVVCPDDRHAEKIREQRVRFLKYDPAMKFAMGGV